MMIRTIRKILITMAAIAPQPRMMKYAINACGIATGGGTLAHQMLAPTGRKPTRLDDWLAVPVTADANDFIYQWKPRTIAIRPPASTDRGVCLPSTPTTTSAIRRRTGVSDAAMKRRRTAGVSHPGLDQTRGHLTTGNAAFYQKQLQELLRTALQRTI